MPPAPTSSAAKNCAAPSSGILDLDRLLARISLDSAGPRDVLALAASLKHLPDVRKSAAFCIQHKKRSVTGRRRRRRTQRP
jgi:hypothetical protein